MKQTVTLHKGWKFSRQDSLSFSAVDCDDSGWQDVVVPHDWAIAGPFNAKNDFYSTRIVQNGETGSTPHYGRTGALPHIGTAWYRHAFEVEGASKGKAFFVEFDGIMSHSTVYVNGQKVGGRPFGYMSFSLDITPFIKYDAKNVIAVRVDNPEQASRWYPGAGIIREARLIIAEPEHFAYNGIWVYDTSLDVESAKALVACKLEISGKDCQTQLDVADSEGKVIATANTAGNEMEVSLDNLKLWTPETPVLYSFCFKLIKQGQVCDERVVKHGFRTLRFDANNGMFLNGRPYMLKGVCLHHDHGPLGAAFSVPAMTRQMTLLKEMGCNAIRTSHNPPAPQLLDLCDSMGFAVMDEAFDCWVHGKTANDYNTLFAEWHERDLTDFIRRDRNHPAVFFWSIGNEINEQSVPDGRPVAEMLAKIVRKTDPCRLVSAGLDRPDHCFKNDLPTTLDLIGWNYKPHRYPELHEKYPAFPQFGSETASTISTRGEYIFPLAEGQHTHPNLQCSAFDTEYPGWATSPDREFAAQAEYPWIFGEFVWTGFDYLGEPTPYDGHWPSHSSYFGIYDLVGLPKDRVWLYKANWTKEPILHLMPHWTWPGREGQTTPVQVYTNYDRVELFVNQISMGIQIREKNHYRLQWKDVVYQPGELRAVALDDAGNGIAVATVKTAGPAAKIVLMANRENLRSGIDDLSYITASVQDAEGAARPEDYQPIHFTVKGAGAFAAAGNGDPLCLEDFNCGTMSAFHGLCVAIVRAGEEAGDIIVTASAPGLQSAEITLHVK